MSDLASVLHHRAWMRREWPFPHVVARHVFTDAVYRRMAAEYTAILRRGFSEGASPWTFSRNLTGYDAYGLGFGPSLAGALGLFGSLEWHDMMADLFGITATEHINIGAHHHSIGSVSGWIHNDLNPVWFPIEGRGTLRHPEHERCEYRTGAGPLLPSEKQEVVRAVAMLFYLANDGWVEGCGGETGLFESASGPVDTPCAKVPPENNSILLFECTPKSYHTFLRNSGCARNSIIMWIHRSKDDALSRFAAADLERWVL